MSGIDWFASVAAQRSARFLLCALACSMVVISIARADEYSGVPVVTVSATAIQVKFSGDPVVEATLAIENGEVIGLSHVVVDGQEVLSPPSSGFSPPVLRRITGGAIEPITDLDAYLAERAAVGDMYSFPSRGEIMTEDVPLHASLNGWRQHGETVVIEASCPFGHVEWWLAPASTQTYGGNYAGVSWQLKLYKTNAVYEIIVEEPVVFAEGDWRLQQRGNQSDEKYEEEFRLSLTPDPENPYSMSKRKYGARQQPYFFIAGSRGATLSYFNGVCCAEVEEAQKEDRVLLRSSIPVRPDAEGCLVTPAKAWVFRPADLVVKWDAINEWTWAWDRVIGDLHTQMGMTLTEPLPTLFHQQFDTPGLAYGFADTVRKSMEVPAFEQSWLRQFADDIVPKAASWGIGVIELRAVLDSDVDHAESECPPGSFATLSLCSPWGLRISPKLGGEAGLAYVVDKAHAQGIKVTIWSAPAHQSVCSPVVREHLDWLMFEANGRPNHRGYVDLMGMDLAAGFRAYMEKGYADLRAQTGLDGVWADSYCAFGADRNMANPIPFPQLEETIALQKAMQDMGYNYMMKEDCGPFGISTRSSGLHGILGREYLRYYFLYNHSDPTMRYEPDTYFRSLASKGILELRVPAVFESQPGEARERIIRANKAYREVLPLMKRREVIGTGDVWQGVAWADGEDQQRVLFSFDTFDWSCPEGAQYRDLMTGEAVTAFSGSIQTKPWRVYLLNQPEAASIVR